MRKIDGANILLVIRENIVNDWEGLVKEFATDRKGRLVDTDAYKLRSKLNHLQNLGFVEFEEDSNNPDDIVGAIEITKHWTRTHKILGGQPLEELADLSSGGMVVNPILGRPEGSGEEADLFVIMPFLAELLPVYEDHIVAAARELGCDVTSSLIRLIDQAQGKTIRAVSFVDIGDDLQVIGFHVEPPEQSR